MEGEVTRRRFPRSERRAEILDVAARQFHARGYEAASLQDIADELGLRKATLYYYFASKEALLHALLAEIIHAGMLNLQTILALGGDPLTRLWRMVVGHIDQLCRFPVETAVFLHERKRIPPEQRSKVLGDEYTYQAAFITCIKDGQSCGQILPEIDPKLAALSVLGSANWTYTWYRAGGDLRPRYIGTQFAAMTVNSLATVAALKDWRQPLASVDEPTRRAAQRERTASGADG